MSKYFDLNIGTILEHWKVSHALREIIANAMDETALSKASKPYEITHDKETKECIIRDYGRGLKHNHFVQNESSEKIEDLTVIGKFGFGLKDAMATFNRNKIGITIKSKHGIMTIVNHAKANFGNIETLHIKVDEHTSEDDKNFSGTLFTFSNVSENDMNESKEFFLAFDIDRKVLEKGKFGEILIRKAKQPSKIYINGIKVSEEENFLFSYNITSITALMRKALNRERTHVGRTVYAERIKAILSSAEDKKIMDLMIADMNKDIHADDVSYSDVQVHIIKHMNLTGNAVFITNDDYKASASMIDEARKNGKTIITVSKLINEKLNITKDTNGKNIVNMQEFKKERASNLDGIETIPYNNLTEQEKIIYDKSEKIINLVGYKLGNKKIYISNNMTNKLGDGFLIDGLCRGNDIYMDRKTLSSLPRYAGVLIHEFTHSYSGYIDVTREFETVLTTHLGTIAAKLV
jgi:hypothetical protein